MLKYWLDSWADYIRPPKKDNNRQLSNISWNGHGCACVWLFLCGQCRNCNWNFTLVCLPHRKVKLPWLLNTYTACLLLHCVITSCDLLRWIVYSGRCRLLLAYGNYNLYETVHFPAYNSLGTNFRKYTHTHTPYSFEVQLSNGNHFYPRTLRSSTVNKNERTRTTDKN